MRPGRKPGTPKTGGRQKGTLNKSTVANQEALQDALRVAFADIGASAIDDLTPAQFQLVAMRAAAKGGHYGAALTIAKEVAPYFDPKLAQSTVTGKLTVTLEQLVTSSLVPETEKAA